MKKTIIALSLTPLVLSGCTDSLLSLTGYTASMTCSKTFETGLDWQTIYDQDLNPITQGNVDRADITIDLENKMVTSRSMGVSKTAVYRSGLGCSLVGEEGIDALLNQAYPDRYVDAQPEQSWPVGQQVEMSESADYSQLESLANQHFTEFKSYAVNSHSLAVVQNGKLIFEHYADGYDSNTPIYGFSVTKTIGALFVGSLSDRELLDVNEPLMVPEWQNDARKNITAHHLLTMTSGLDFSETYEDYESDANMLFVVDDMANFSIEQPVMAEPGTVFNYSTGDTMVLSGEIKRLLGGTLEAGKIHLDHNVLSPIGFTDSVIQADSVGNLVFGMQGLITTHDMARLGQFLLQKGRWNEEQVISEDWIEYMSEPVLLSNPLGYSYGAGIWVNSDINGRKFLPSLPNDTLIAFGLRGQFVIVSPSLDLVIVRTGSTLDAYDFIQDMDELAEGIIQAL